jgi:hypothetical protein
MKRQNNRIVKNRYNVVYKEINRINRKKLDRVRRRLDKGYKVR